MICYNLGRYENHRNASVAWTQLDKQIRIQSPRLVDLNFSGGALQWDGGALSKKHLKACMEKYFVLVFLGMDFFFFARLK
jgi:hypothetical protein